MDRAHPAVIFCAPGGPAPAVGAERHTFAAFDVLVEQGQRAFAFAAPCGRVDPQVDDEPV